MGKSRVLNFRTVASTQLEQAILVGKQGHFAKVCRSRTINEVEEEDSSSSDSEIFLGEVTSTNQKPWVANITVNNHETVFKLDSGAVVTVVPRRIYEEIVDRPTLVRTSKTLYGPCRYRLRYRGKFKAVLEHLHRRDLRTR